MKTNEEIKEWILQNCIDENGDIDLSSLNFSDFDGDIYRGWWKVKGDLRDDNNEVKGDLHQYGNKVKGKTFIDLDNHNKVMKFVGRQGWVEDERFKRKLEDMTKEELIKKIREMENNENKK